MSLVKLNKFIHSLLFGNKNYEIPNDLFVNQLKLQLEKNNINVKQTIQFGGLLLSNYVIQKDLQDILMYIKHGNSIYYDKCIDKNQSLNLKSFIANNFFSELSSICRGDLEYGATANSSVLENKEKFFERDDKCISLNPPLKHYHNAIKLYDIKCKSIGKIVDPFKFVLTPHSTYVDYVHWESEDNLKEFLIHYPIHPLSVSVKNLLESVFKSIIFADENILPKGIFEEEKQIKLFLENINIINERIEKVDGKNAPPKLIDLIHRLLAKVKLDTLWLDVNFVEKTTNTSENHLYIKLADLENENRLLRAAISIQ
ncbi:uncharacterized protein TNCT_455561 [Trichonephila clavata]|uniref:Uncharacterized protein n=1 Tax=Trichonephila clavata TaxID=2740835 RepID=A0A8X6M5Y7_TRICU|nr:uncharacterized protein TNCT_455561 [Trichonephila clavata]